MKILEQLEDYFHKSPLAFMKTASINSIVFDKRAEYMCKYGCKNYNRKHSCPPSSLFISKKFRNPNYKWAILFATTYKIPKDYSRYKIRMYNYQKELEIQRISNQFNNLLRINGMKGIVLSGGACKKCKDCSLKYGRGCKKPLLKQTSMEAVGIDCQKTMHNAGFDFQMPNIGSINKCGCVFTNERDLSKMDFKKKESFQSFKSPFKKETTRMCSKLLIKHPELFKSIDIISTSALNIGKIICNEKCKNYGKNFACPPYSDKIRIKLWKNVILWEWKENDYKKYQYNTALKEIHKSIFSMGYYFALSIRDCYCDNCKICTFSMGDKSVCSFRQILSPSMQSQGINPQSFGKGKFGLELI